RAAPGRLVQPVDQMALMVRLAHVDPDAQRLRLVLQPRRDVVERVPAVNLRLARAEQVEVGPIEDIDQRWRRHGAPLYDAERRRAKASILPMVHDGTISIRVNGA